MKHANDFNFVSPPFKTLWDNEWSRDLFFYAQTVCGKASSCASECLPQITLAHFYGEKLGFHFLGDDSNRSCEFWFRI